MANLRTIEFLYRYEKDDDGEDWGKITAKFHTWFNDGHELFMVVENDNGEVNFYSHENCADIKFIDND